MDNYRDLDEYIHNKERERYESALVRIAELEKQLGLEPSVPDPITIPTSKQPLALEPVNLSEMAEVWRKGWARAMSERELDMRSNGKNHA